MIYAVIEIAEYGASKYVHTGLWGKFGDAVFSHIRSTPHYRLKNHLTLMAYQDNINYSKY